MGHQLWYSRSTKIRRKNTRIVDIEKNILNKFTVDLLYENILSVSKDVSSQEAIYLMTERDFDFIGVMDESCENIGYIAKFNIEVTSPLPIQEFNQKLVLSTNTPLFSIFKIFLNEPIIFVKSEKVIGIISPADFNKPICRIYIFSIISLFEMHLNYWITYFYEDGSWSEMVTPLRLKKAEDLYKERKGKNEDLTLLECIQLADKKTILLKTNHFLKQFDFSKEKFRSLMKMVEPIRNEIAHSQNSITANKGIVPLCGLINDLIKILHKSDYIIENID